MELILQKEIAFLHSRRYAKGNLGVRVQSSQKLKNSLERHDNMSGL